MGKLAHFSLDNMLRLFGLQHFVETGTGGGDSLLIACQQPFKTLWSCDIEPLLIERLRPTLQDERVHLFLGQSVQMLDLLPLLPTDPILFWLDAHFPGADYGLRPYGAETDEAIRLPLQQELALIKRHRPANPDVIIIDDARLWLDGPFEPLHPELLAACMPSQRGEAVFAVFADSHDITVLYDQQGFVVITPKSVELKTGPHGPVSSVFS
jgi:hypothetical protein